MRCGRSGTGIVPTARIVRTVRIAPIIRIILDDAGDRKGAIVRIVRRCPNIGSGDFNPEMCVSLLWHVDDNRRAR